MTDELKLTVRTFPMQDTGIGREAGFRDDAELIEVAQAERATWSPQERELADRIDAEVERQILGL